MKSVSMVYMIFFVVGAILLVVGVGIAVNTVQYTNNANSAEGIVIDIVKETHRDSDNDLVTTYRPQVEFETNNDEYKTFFSKIGSNPSQYSKGDKVKVLYTETPKLKAEIDNVLFLWFLPTIFIFMGAIFAGIALVGFKSQLNYRKREINRM